MDPPPLDPTTGAKGSALLQEMSHVSLRPAEPRAGVEASQQHEEDAMTKQKDLKTLIRQQQASTGESYSTARMQIVRARDGGDDALPARPVTAIVLKVGAHDARVRLVDSDEEVTLKSASVQTIVPGHFITIRIAKRWSWSGHPYMSGEVLSWRIDASGLGLDPLGVEVAGMSDLAESVQGFEDPDPYAPLWRQLTANPRPTLQFDEAALGPPFDKRAPDADPVADAADLIHAGEMSEAHGLLNDTLYGDLRCTDAHADLGIIALRFDRHLALEHYRVGIAIAELSIPPGFDGAILWGVPFNRPFLRCLHGEGLCLWRLGRFAEAAATFERLLAFNPNDNQGIRFIVDAVRAGRLWDDAA